MADYLVNNFTSGEISPKLGGRPDLGIYHTGVQRFENFYALLQGGACRRPGTKLLAPLEEECRIIPFTLSVDVSFILVLSEGKLRFLEPDGTTYQVLVEGEDNDGGKKVPYRASELSEVQYTQDYNTLYLVHRDYPPKMLSYLAGSLTWATLRPLYDETLYPNLFKSSGNYPGCVAYCSNRLWFASSINHPYRLWASRPFNTIDFQTSDVVTTKEKQIKDAPWPEGWEEDQTHIYEEVETVRKIVSADNAMVLEVGSNRNDRIEWLTVGRNLLVGTASGEWIMPGNIDALNQSIVLTSNYGSASLQAINVNEDVLFIQSGRKRCRGYVMAEGGYSSPDLTYTADHILESGVREWAFQRIPEPRVYMVLNNGMMAVLSYNKMYQIQGWARWTFEGEVRSVCVIDVPEGQHVLVVVKRGDAHTLEMFDEQAGKYVDLHNTGNPIPFESVLVSNRFETQLETGFSIGKQKKISSIVLRLLDSGPFKAGYNGLETFTEEIEEGDVEIRLGGGYQKELRMEIRSIEANHLTILAMMYNMEVG